MERIPDWLVALIIFSLYFLPGIYAYSKKHPRRDAILLINLVLGWTLLGWLVAVIWASILPEKK